MKADGSDNVQPADQSTAQNPNASADNSNDTLLLPQVASTLNTASEAILSAASGVASTVKTATSDALAWTENKVDKLSAKEEDGTGPYGSTATCAPSEFDVIGQGILPALPKENVEPKDDEGQERRDSKGVEDTESD